MSERTVSFEVYVKSRGRWELHARHGAISREDAVNEAKALERLKSIDAVRVVRELYDDSAGKSREYPVYENPPPSASKREPTSEDNDLAVLEEAFGPIEFEPDEAGDDTGSGRPRVPSKSKVRGGQGPSPLQSGIWRLVAIVGGSLTVAVLLTLVTIFTIAELPELRRLLGLRQTGYNIMLFVVFISSFAVCLGVSAYWNFARLNSAIPSRGPVPTQPAATASPRASQPSGTASVRSAGIGTGPEPGGKRGIRWFDFFAAWRWRRRRPAASRPAARPAPKAETLDPLPPMDDVAEEVLDEEVEDELPADVALSMEAERQKSTIMSFLIHGLRVVHASRPTLDRYNVLGVHLYLAGACEFAGTESGLRDAEVEQILQDGVILLGTDAAQAHQFAHSLDSYLLEPKYLTMIEAGRAAMATHVAGLDASLQLQDALEVWNRSTAVDDAPTDTIAVLFTNDDDVVALTQTHGEDVAQELVRLHNRVVRDSLTLHQGHEIKHEGNGIMASFASARNAVGAAVDIQEKIAVHNLNAAIPLRLKIGIHAGEPVAEDGEIYGTTVKLAERIAKSADPGSVLVSTIVSSLCEGAAFEFGDQSPREFDTVPEPVALCEVAWNRPEPDKPVPEEPTPPK